MKKIVILSMVICLGVAVLSIAENMGAENMTLDGGSRGKVPFPHKAHQTGMKGDCNACHDIFGKKTGAINNLKSKKELTPKQVMNKKCIKCHRANRAEGKSTGPITCSSCHVRE